jgi:hypothetical protein
VRGGRELYAEMREEHYASLEERKFKTLAQVPSRPRRPWYPAISPVPCCHECRSSITVRSVTRKGGREGGEGGKEGRERGRDCWKKRGRRRGEQKREGMLEHASAASQPAGPAIDPAAVES